MKLKQFMIFKQFMKFIKSKRLKKCNKFMKFMTITTYGQLNDWNGWKEFLRSNEGRNYRFFKGKWLKFIKGKWLKKTKVGLRAQAAKQACAKKKPLKFSFHISTKIYMHTKFQSDWFTQNYWQGFWSYYKGRACHDCRFCLMQ